jgi:hypothetical protein
MSNKCGQGWERAGNLVPGDVVFYSNYSNKRAVLVVSVKHHKNVDVQRSYVTTLRDSTLMSTWVDNNDLYFVMIRADDY